MPKGVPKAPTSLREQLEHELQEIERRLKLEDLREGQRAKLATFLAKSVPLLTQRDITRIVKAMPPDTVRLNSDAAKGALESGKGRGKGGGGPAIGALGKALRAYREKHELSRTALAKQLRCHISNVGFWERGGGKPGPDIAKRLEKLGVPVAKLIAQNGHAGADG